MKAEVDLGDGLTVVDVGEDLDLDESTVTVDGEVLTSARADAIAREVARRHGARGGRPRKPDAEKASEQRAVRLTPADAALLRQVAGARGISETALIREVLLREIRSAS